jgi:PIN domain nuclease of toxin-antitoxin system
MTTGSLLDTHVLVWLDSASFIRPDALLAMEEANLAKQLFASHISYWELGVAQTKKRIENRPNLRGLTPDGWVREVAQRFDIRMLALTARIAAEAANIPSIYGSGDPGDCFLIATARVRNLSLLTRDARIIDLAKSRPDYVTVIAC